MFIDKLLTVEGQTSDLSRLPLLMFSMAASTEPLRVESDLEACLSTNEKDEKQAPTLHCEDAMEVPDLIRTVDQEAERRSVPTLIA